MNPNIIHAIPKMYNTSLILYVSHSEASWLLVKDDPPGFAYISHNYNCRITYHKFWTFHSDQVMVDKWTNKKLLFKRKAGLQLKVTTGPSDYVVHLFYWEIKQFSVYFHFEY